MPSETGASGLDKKTVKIIQLFLGATTLGFKYEQIQNLTQMDYYSPESIRDHDMVTEILLCITYFGLLFLKSMAVISAISGLIPRGNYVKYFHITGSLAYLASEVLILRKIWNTFAAMPMVGIVITIFGVVVTLFLIVALLLDVFNVI